MTVSQIIDLLIQGIRETLYMVLISTTAAYVIGIPLGVLLVVTDRDGIRPVPVLNSVIGAIINLIRSVPFIILLVTVIPLTRAIVGTTLGTPATIVPLVIASAPYVGRLVESSLKEVDNGVIEAARSMGASTYQIIYKVLLREALPSLIMGAAIAVTTILGYSTMAGFVGGGGLGDIGIRYGYHRYQQDIMFITVAALVVIVQILQVTGTRLSGFSDKRKL